MHIHILGVCGTFMGGIAAIAKVAGHRVTGCDANVYPPMSTQLEAEGIELTVGYGADQTALNPDMWVIGNVVSRGNPLMEAILDRGDRYVSGPQWLAENALSGKRVLAVAGTHGKTTTSSMVAWILEDAGLDPGFLIGGVPINFGVSARLGARPDFVIEADEYDTAFFDKRSKMVHYRPRLAVLNNIEFDHADIFADLAAIETQFHHFVRTIPGSGKLIVNGADPAIDRVLARGCWSAVERFGVGDGWSVNAVGTGCFEIFDHGRPVGLLRWDLQGEHNLQNALAAVAAAQAAGVDPAQAIESLAGFKGVRRRMELRGTVAGVAVWDDFAHHPTAIATTVSGLRDQVGRARILAVLEPRSSTMRAGLMKDRLSASLEQADRIFCFNANLGWDVAAALAPLGRRATIESDLERLVGAIVAEAQPGDQVLVMSNGGFGGIHERLLASLSARAAPATGA
ncbi:MAG: UDP-N-acetylmuramate:L-alanyl-gamma-D-glutamyl-meso-diaminopimelate ligase [Betaproteobacteria bacterium]|nr:MAG: UDP-N-acetylmuramate:L-alanyl-gamma-D-glutamyl-meso-diaminopimelate ligase [Betaproteobacteria bacterium]